MAVLPSRTPAAAREPPIPTSTAPLITSFLFSRTPTSAARPLPMGPPLVPRSGVRTSQANPRPVSCPRPVVRLRQLAPHPVVQVLGALEADDQRVPAVGTFVVAGVEDGFGIDEDLGALVQRDAHLVGPVELIAPEHQGAVGIIGQLEPEPDDPPVDHRVEAVVVVEVQPPAGLPDGGRLLPDYLDPPEPVADRVHVADETGRTGGA